MLPEICVRITGASKDYSTEAALSYFARVGCADCLSGHPDGDGKTMTIPGCVFIVIIVITVIG
jgi:hypothetical protein